ncbi:hypothetical protein AAHA92_28653 [Salvia divinorum]|uniref:Uncharacterized protein n=1 Tax=Salvia divinorum TaxID=28513 RepID=A0ABD1FYK5_SALDI
MPLRYIELRRRHLRLTRRRNRSRRCPSSRRRCCPAFRRRRVIRAAVARHSSISLSAGDLCCCWVRTATVLSSPSCPVASSGCGSSTEEREALESF